MKMFDETPGVARAASQHPAGGGGNGALIGLGIIVLLGAAGGILWWVSKKDAGTPQTTTQQSAPSASTSAPPPESTVELPPLPKDEPDAGEDAADAAAEAGAKVANNGGGGAGLCGGPCKGTVSTELRNFISGRGAAAKTCYRSALEAQDTLQGDITVSLRINSDGSLCSVGIVSDTVGNAALASCVKQKMQTRYPAPSGGCVDQSVKVNFKPQTK